MLPAEQEEVLASYGSRRQLYVSLADAGATLVSQLLATAGVVPHAIESRAKELSSLREKLARHQTYSSLGDVTDLCGIRIVLYYPSEVRTVAELLRAEFAISEHLIIGAEVPEAFGYSSVHLVGKLSEDRGRLREWKLYGDLVVEIQVRTVLQHSWAAISHRLAYKTNEAIPAETRRKLFRVAALLETGDELFDSFREDVEKLRREYDARSAANEWQDLPIDLDSLKAAWSAMQMDQLADAVAAHGFNRSTPEEAQNRLDIDLGHLVQNAAACDLKTLKDLTEAINAGLRKAETLNRIAAARTESGGNYGWSPAALVRAAMVLASPSARPSPVFAEPIQQCFGDTTVGEASGSQQGAG